MDDAAPQDLAWAIKKVAAGESLTQTESAEAFEQIMSGGENAARHALTHTAKTNKSNLHTVVL